MDGIQTDDEIIHFEAAAEDLALRVAAALRAAASPLISFTKHHTPVPRTRCQSRGSSSRSSSVPKSPKKARQLGWRRQFSLPPTLPLPLSHDAFVRHVSQRTAGTARHCARDLYYWTHQCLFRLRHAATSRDDEVGLDSQRRTGPSSERGATTKRDRTAAIANGLRERISPSQSRAGCLACTVDLR